MANTYITRTPSSAGNRRKFTISMWVKRVKLGVDQWLVQAGASGSEFDIRFTTSDTLRFSTWDGSNGYGMITTRVFRDTSAWYHLVFQYDTAQATDTNRNKIYINGEQINPSDTSAYNAGKHPPQNYDNPSWNNTTAFRINDVTWTSSSPKDAVYSHIHHTDGYAYDASTFGSTDSTTGEWKINTSPSITMGTNGFTILKDGNTITDQSSNSNDFSLGGGTLTKTEDCPSNVFATMNPLALYHSSGGTLSNGNNSYVWSNYQINTRSTLGMPKGKFYWEQKCLGDEGSNRIGMCTSAFTNYIDTDSSDAHYNSTGNGGIYLMMSAASTSWQRTNNDTSKNVDTYTNATALATNNIIMNAVDVDAGKYWIGINGTWMYSGNPATGSNPQITFTNSGGDDLHVFLGSGTNGSRSFTFNFGNGFFGTTEISSAGTNASGIGRFEYDVPTGYTALSTKGLNL